MTKNKNNLFYVALSISLLLFFGCTRDIDKPTSPPIDISTIPPTPGNLSVQVGDGFVILSWSVSDTTPVAGYRIYSADSSDADYALIGDSQDETYTAGNLLNGRLYYFRVSSINSDEFEGYKSAPVSAVPELYAVLINNGNLYTNDVNVTLSFTAPAGTRFVQVSDDSVFSNSQWEIYTGVRNYILQDTDGLKNVYCRFRDSADRLTWSYFVDSITLDTEAFIDSVTFSPAGPFSPGEMIHFYLYAGEYDGSAGITIGSNVAEIDLFDNGQRGDNAADDGVYEADYLIPVTFDFENNYVYGRFIDRAENMAPSVVAGNRISVRRPPDAVNVFSINVPQGEYDRLELNWERSTAQDFAQYRIYRATSPGVDSTDFMAASITSIATTSLNDTGLVESTSYYYKVFVVDMTGLWAGSNEVNATTGADLPPEPVDLYPVIVEPDQYQEFDIEWSQSFENDFESYRLYRWQEDVGRNDSVLAAFISNRATTVFTDSPPFSTSEDTLNLWYILYVYDDGGGTSSSDSVRVHLVDDTPPIVTGSVASSDSSLIVSWSQTDIPDFNSYQLLRDTDSNPTGAITVFVTPDRAAVSYDDDSTVEGQTYYYWLEIYDIRGNYSRSFLGPGVW